MDNKSNYIKLHDSKMSF